MVNAGLEPRVGRQAIDADFAVDAALLETALKVAKLELETRCEIRETKSAPDPTNSRDNGPAVTPEVEAFRPEDFASWCRRHGRPYVEIFGRTSPSKSYIERPGTRQPMAFKSIRPTIFYGQLQGATILAPTALICTPDGALIYDGFLHRSDFFAHTLPPDVRVGQRIDESDSGRATYDTPIETECVHIGGSQNFGHFVFESLLKLAVLHWCPRIQALPIAVHDALPARFLEFLDILGFSADRRIRIPFDRPSRFKHAWVVPHPMRTKTSHSDFGVLPEALHALRLACAGLQRLASLQRSRLYLDRSDARWRRLANETEILPILGQFGVTGVEMSALPARDQISLVSSAEIIVLQLGAGGAITAFAPPDCVVIELSPRHVQAMWRPPLFASILGQIIYRIVGRRASPEDAAAFGLKLADRIMDADADYLIETDQLAAALAIADDICRRNASTQR